MRAAKAALLALAGLGLWPALEQPAAAAEAESGDAQQEIVVTAQRRPERPEDVPIFLTPLSGDRLEQAQATSLAELGKVVPSLVMLRTGPFTQPFLRGVGKRSTLGVENSVATYVDGVYLASSISALLDLRGIERVEVLNGPQGTLFGRNATGGVIQIITRDPSPKESFEAELEAGSYGYVRGDAYVSGGSDRLAANLALSLSRNGGYGTNLFTGKHDQGAVHHSLVARNKWVMRPAGAVKLTLSGDYQDIDYDFSQRPVAGYPAVGAPRVQDFRDGDQDGGNRHRYLYGGVSARADAEIGSLALMSLSAARWMHARYDTELDQGPQPLLAAITTADQKQLSQELQLQSKLDSPVRWVAGLYYIRIEESYEPTLFTYGGSYSARLGGRTRQLLADLGTASSLAGYGQATWRIARRTNLTAGLRYTVERRTVSAQGEQIYDTPPFVRPIPGLPLPTQEPFKSHETFREPSWRVALDHHLSDRLMAYVSASRGFKSGGWNLQTPQAPAFAPETLDAFEGGLKYADRGRGLRAEASLFHYDYSDLQVSAFTPLGSATTNATSADIQGLDLQMEAQPGRRTQVSLGAQLLSARFNAFANAVCTNFGAGAAVPYAPVACDASGNRLPFAPRLKLNAGAVQDVPLGKKGSLRLSVNLAYNSGYYSEADNVVRQTAFATIDASVEWRPSRRGPVFSLWARNLTDAHYSDSLVTFPTTGVLQRPAAPRRFGLSIAFAS